MENILPTTKEDTTQGKDALSESFALVEFLTVLAEVDMEQRKEEKYQKEVINNENNRS